MHCNLATGGPGAATRHAPFGRPRRPLGTFPRGESTSSARRRTKPLTRNGFLVDGREGGFLAFLCFAGFRLCGGDQRAFRSPFGNLRALAAKGWRKKTDSLWMARKSPSLLLPVLRRISPLRRRPKGFPIALWKPSAPMLRMEICTKMDCAKSSIYSKKRASQAFPPAWHAFILPFFLSHPAPVAQLPPCLPPRWWHDAVPAIPAAAAPAAAPAHR